MITIITMIHHNSYHYYHHHHHHIAFIITIIVYGSSLALTSGEASYVQARGMMDIDIVTVSTDHQFMVLFSDYSNNGIVTAVIGEVIIYDDTDDETYNNNNDDDTYNNNDDDDDKDIRYSSEQPL